MVILAFMYKSILNKSLKVFCTQNYQTSLFPDQKQINMHKGRRIKTEAKTLYLEFIQFAFLIRNKFFYLDFNLFFYPQWLTLMIGYSL
jgi:hypothetical protein